MSKRAKATAAQKNKPSREQTELNKKNKKKLYFNSFNLLMYFTFISCALILWCIHVKTIQQQKKTVIHIKHYNVYVKFFVHFYNMNIVYREFII